MFEEGQAENAAQKGPPVTKLMAYFATNRADPLARGILYPDFPQYFTWDTKNRCWHRRKRGATCADGQVVGDTLGRIPTVSLSPHQSELYYLRMLLHNKAGAQSYEDLRTIDGHMSPTFQEACRCMGLLEDDSERDAAMTEAASIRFGSHLRDLFANILIYCKPTNPLEFYERHKIELCRDIMLREGANTPTEVMHNEVLLALQERVARDGLDISKDFHLPPPNLDLARSQAQTRVLREEMSYDISYLQSKVTDEYKTLNEQQRIVFDAILASVTQNSGHIFSLNACGGSGKTYTLNLLLAAVHSQKTIALATAMSGIAGTLLANGRTVHSRCKVPLLLGDESTCHISKQDSTAELFWQATLLVIDEVTMGHRHIYEAIDRTLRDIRENDCMFGGLTVRWGLATDSPSRSSWFQVRHCGCMCETIIHMATCTCTGSD